MVGESFDELNVAHYTRLGREQKIERKVTMGKNIILL